MADKLRVILIGDVVGNFGCFIFQKHIAKLKKEYKADFVIVNGENSSTRGRGITPKVADFFRHNGVDVITSGNHIWAEKDIYNYIHQNNNYLLRPANFPPGTPGSGSAIVDCGGVLVGVLNIQGRVFMPQQLDDPFRVADTNISFLRSKTNIILVDFHAETTAEKIGLAYHLDGRVTAVVGTHTHVQTADERILPKGTAFITDLGMTGALDSMIGMNKDIILQNMKTQMPAKYEVEDQGAGLMSGVCVEVDVKTGMANSIERIRLIDQAVNYGF